MKGRPKGSPKVGGRKKGTPNKIPFAIREAVLEALERSGGADYLVRQATANPTAFLGLIGKVIPKEVNATLQSDAVVQVITGVNAPAKADDANKS